MANEAMPVFVTNLTFEGEAGLTERPAIVVTPGVRQTGVMRLVFGDQNAANFDPATCYPLQHWRSAGLNRPLFVDTTTLFNLPTPLVIANRPLGKLSHLDTLSLFDFINK